MTIEETSGEPCQRCGEVGEDRRTLMHACFYDMSELDLPFERCAIEGRYKAFSHMEKLSLGFSVPRFQEEEASGDPHTHQFFTLRVCKSCRASWMEGIKQWFKNPGLWDFSRDQETGTGVYLRKLGRTYEASPAEVDALTGKLEAPEPAVGLVSLDDLLRLQAQIERNTALMQGIIAKPTTKIPSDKGPSDD